MCSFYLGICTYNSHSHFSTCAKVVINEDVPQINHVNLISKGLSHLRA